jgi:hypothetical protein
MGEGTSHALCLRAIQSWHDARFIWMTGHPSVSLGRVASVSVLYSKHDERAHGPSQLGTGETSNPNPAAPGF